MTEQSTQTERAMLIEAQQQGGVSTVKTYLRLSGPGWLQSAITLGGGSLSGALFLGVLGGTEMLWLQLMAIIMGVVMLSAISYVTLSTGERPFPLINKHINPVLGWGWLLATITANMIWCMPQFGLCFEALEKNLIGFGNTEAYLAATKNGDQMYAYKIGISAAFLILASGLVYLNSQRGIAAKVFDWALKIMVGIVVISFFGVVVTLTVQGELAWGAILSGFIPDLTQWTTPTGAVAENISGFSGNIASFWNGRVVQSQRDVMIGAAATAVGINMTFLLPYSMLARKWDKPFRGLARFDLATGMAIPYVLVTSCVVIASAAMFHGKMDSKFGSPELSVMKESPLYGDGSKILITRLEAIVSSQEFTLAGTPTVGETWTISLKLEDAQKTVFATATHKVVVGDTVTKIAADWSTQLASDPDIHTLVTNARIAIHFLDGEAFTVELSHAADVDDDGIIPPNPNNGPLVQANDDGGTKMDYSVKSLPEKDKEKMIADLPIEEKEVAASLVKRNAFQLSESLAPLLGATMANMIFGIGVLGMGFSSIIILMLINGYAFCELLGKKQGGAPHIVGCLIAGLIGASWWLFWDGGAKMWLAILVSAFGMMLLPIAYVTFMLMMNSKKILGEDKPQGISLIAWNAVMGISVLGAVAAALTAIIDKGSHPIAGPVVITIGVVFVILTIGGFVFKSVRKEASE